MSVKRPLDTMRKRSGCIQGGPSSFFILNEPGERVLGGAQAPRGLEADVDADALAKVAQGARHHKAHRQGRVHPPLPGRLA